MKMLERIREGIGSGEYRGIYEESDGRHFCVACGKMMRPGQEAIHRTMPAFRARGTDSTYAHYSECPA